MPSGEDAVPGLQEMAAHYLALLGGPRHEDAYHSLIEMDHAVVPILASAHEREPAPDRRAAIVEVAWQHRTPESLGLLARAVADPQDAVWKAALDGFVAIGGPRARRLLEAERSRLAGFGPASAEQLEWLEEAIGQIDEAMRDPRSRADEADP